MKLISIKPYCISYCAKKKNKDKSDISPRLEDKNSLASQVLSLHDKKTIDRFNKLKSSFFSRKLTDDEAYFLACPWSLNYADFCERRKDFGYNLYGLDEIARFEIDSREKFGDLRYFSDDEIQQFIDLKDKSEFNSVSQIARYIWLTSTKNGLPSTLTPLEARYFAKKCASSSEIQRYLLEKLANPCLILLNRRFDFDKFSLRQRQDNHKDVISLKAENGSEKRYFTLVDGKFYTVSKTNIEDNCFVNHDSIKRSTAFVRMAEILHKNEEAYYSYDVIEILNNESGVVDRITRTYFDKNDCVVYTKIYNLGEYPEDLDVLNLVKNDLIEPTKTTTKKIEYPDGSIFVEQRFATKDAILIRTYKISDKFWELELIIKDIDGKTIYNTNRKFENIDDNTSITQINGKKYIAKANDAKEQILIEYDNKDFLISGLIDDSIFFDDDESNGDSNVLWEFCKTKLPADLMMITRRLQNSLIPINDELSSEYAGGLFGGIYTAPNVATLSHEIGHLLSDFNHDINKGCHLGLPYISQDEKLMEIYNKELAEFNINHSEFVSKNTIRYFGELGGTIDRLNENETLQARDKLQKEAISHSTGLEEIVAETMLIKTAPSANNPVIALRTHCLMMYFPRTIAYIANKIDENCKNLL